MLGRPPPPQGDITPEEITNVLRKMKGNKAPGKDGVPTQALKIVHKTHPLYLTGVLNELFKKKQFPKEWKTASVVLIPKPGRDENIPDGFRPICLLPALSKLLMTI